MLKKLIIVAIVAIVSTVQGQSYCANQALRCRTQCADRPCSEACGIRENACNGSNLWVPECPKAPAVRFSPEMVEAVKFSVRSEIGASNVQAKKCKAPCNNQFIVCDEIATTPEQAQDCLIRKQACTASNSCTWVPLCPAK